MLSPRAFALAVATIALGLASNADAREPAPWGSYVNLAVPGFEDAVVWVPSRPPSASGARPVVVALHGLRGRSDWTCHVGRELFDASAFVVCPAGSALPPTSQADRTRPRYTFASVGKTAEEIAAALAAVASQYGSSIDTSEPVLYGHSLGAIFGAALAVHSPSTWTRVLLSEGGYASMAGSEALTFAHGGATRVVFACGTSSCFDGAKQASATLRRAGGNATVEYARGAGHRSYGPIVDAMATKVAWLVQGDRRFQ